MNGTPEFLITNARFSLLGELSHFHSLQPIECHVASVESADADTSFKGTIHQVFMCLLHLIHKIGSAYSSTEHPQIN